MNTDILTYDVVEPFLNVFTVFPMRIAFISVAEGILTNPADTFTTFKESARLSIPLLPDNLVKIFDSAKSSAKSMQATRAAVRVFSILDLSATQRGITSSRESSNEAWMRARCVCYDKNANSIRVLHGTLPIWQKSLPGVAITYLRCAVKVAQKRFRRAIANLEGEDIMKLFTMHEIGETSLELEHLCDKLEHYFSSLKLFVENNCVTPETDPSEENQRARQAFKNTLKHCRALVLEFNKTLPILYVINTHMRDEISTAWQNEVDEGVPWTLQDIDTSHIDAGTHLVEHTQESTKELISTLKSLHDEATGSNDLFGEIAQNQISIIASSNLTCSLIAHLDISALNSVGYSKERPTGSNPEVQNPCSLQQVSSPNRNQKEARTHKVVHYIRNSHFQADIFCIWRSILAADKYLEPDLVTSSDDRSSLQMYLQDEWYEKTIFHIVVPDLVMNAVYGEQSRNLTTATSRIMRRFAEKALQH